MTEEDVAALVADVRADRAPTGELLPLLREDAPVYEGAGRRPRAGSGHG